MNTAINDIGTPYRLAYFGRYSFNDLYSIIIYRGDHTEDLQERNLYIFKADLGYKLYKDLSLRYQHERKRFDIQIGSGEKQVLYRENRIGLSLTAKRIFEIADTKLIWLDDFVIFAYESETDQQLRWVAKIVYGRFVLTNILYFDIDDAGNNPDISHFDQMALDFLMKRTGVLDIYLHTQIQMISDTENVYRGGLGFSF